MDGRWQIGRWIVVALCAYAAVYLIVAGEGLDGKALALVALGVGAVMISRIRDGD